MCAIAPAVLAPEAGARLKEWVANGCHGDMMWMEGRIDQRADPVTLWPEVRSVIMLGMSYAPATDPMALADHPDRARISIYAQGRDYHDVVKGALKRLAGWLVHRSGGTVKVFVDTAPVMERRWPRRRVWAGKASTPMLSAASTAAGCFWARFIRLWSWSRIQRHRTVAAVATHVRLHAPPMRSPRPTAWMRGGVFRI